MDKVHTRTPWTFPAGQQQRQQQQRKPPSPPSVQHPSSSFMTAIGRPLDPDLNLDPQAVALPPQPGLPPLPPSPPHSPIPKGASRSRSSHGTGHLHHPAPPTPRRDDDLSCRHFAPPADVAATAGDAVLGRTTATRRATASGITTMAPAALGCSGCSLEVGLCLPPTYTRAAAFFRSCGVADMAMVAGPLHSWRCRAKLAVRGRPGAPQLGEWACPHHPPTCMHPPPLHSPTCVYPCPHHPPTCMFLFAYVICHILEACFSE